MKLEIIAQANGQEMNLTNLDKEVKEQIKAALAACQTKAAKCGHGGNLTVQMQINSSGAAKSVKAVGGSFAGSATEKCIITVVEKHNWPTFSGKAIPVKYTFKL